MSANDTKRNSETDWRAFDALTDDQIDTSDIPPLGDNFFARAQLRLPDGRVVVRVPVAPEVAAWYRKHGPDQESHMAAALRIYAAAHAEDAAGG